MIQDIEPLKLHNQFKNVVPSNDDKVFCFKGEEFLAKSDDDGNITLPNAGNVVEIDNTANLIFLFSIDEEKYFLYLMKSDVTLENFTMFNVRNLRQFAVKKDCFAAATAFHLYVWYRDNQFCGRCGKAMTHSTKERALVCPECGLMEFPKIAPAVIVGVVDRNRILLTKYAGRAYKRYALIAGFTEIGETAEETVEREVMEEVGLKVKNIKYYKSQPWGTDSNLLMGFFAELDGDDTVKLDTTELSVGEWFYRDSLPVEDDGMSLTREMMGVFKRGEN